MTKFIIDNGAYSAKWGCSTDESPKLTPNYLTKSKNARETYVGSELDECKDFSGLFYQLPFQKGMLVNWDLERQVWNQIFKKSAIDLAQTQLIVTEPIFNFSHTQECLEELVFEELGLDGLIRINAPNLTAYKYLKNNSKDFCLVVDSGYSFTHIAPFYRGNIILEGIRRINMGGKHLTNYLKEIISYRQLMVMDETYVINQVKEELCYVSTDFELDMKIAKLKGKENRITRDYVLPDFANLCKGFAKSQQESTGIPLDSEQIIRLNNERFSIPELLFHPSDIGLNEMGISEAIVHSVESLSEEIRSDLYENIVLMGGNAKFSGFNQRVFNDVRCLIPSKYKLNVSTENDCLGCAWQGGKKLAENETEFNELIVSRKTYEEFGHSICKKKFDIIN
ncbi:actin-related 6 [Brachionus plicatilis]|uniref:Actin-related protein 6 n=1 Tax=Brachionus plicatilis TaxID=10195 RepID=A0A3M7RVR8_BRAPC|nr:actin-related 6 [Brachionus plicatilis]